MKHRINPLATATLLLLMLSIGPTLFARGGTVFQASNYITGKIISASSGRPAPSVWVIIKQSGSERGRSLTGDDGSYYIGKLGNGDYEVLVTKGASQQTERVTLPQNKVFNIRINF
jgi:hypothetical protein